MGATELLLIDFVNITSFPVKQLNDPKATALRDSSAHISMAVETHLDVQQAAEAARFLSSTGRWTVVMAPAAQSVSSQSGTYGGVSLQLRKFLKVTPLEDSSWNQRMWLSSVSPYLNCTYIHVKNLSILTLAGYFRGGIKTPEGSETLASLAYLTNDGKIPFILMADVNATPDELGKSGICEMLDAVIMHTGGATGPKRNIDYILVSKSIKHLVVGLHASWLNPFATHPALRIGLTRNSKELYRWVPATPRSLPKDEWDPREAEALWEK